MYFLQHIRSQKIVTHYSGIIKTISFNTFLSYNYIHTVLEVQKTEICNICMTEIAR